MSAWLLLLAKVLWYFDGYLTAILLGIPLVTCVLNKFSIKEKQSCSTEIKGAGKFLGVLERILVVTFIS